MKNILYLGLIILVIFLLISCEKNNNIKGKKSNIDYDNLKYSDFYNENVYRSINEKIFVLDDIELKKLPYFNSKTIIKIKKYNKINAQKATILFDINEMGEKYHWYYVRYGFYSGWIFGKNILVNYVIEKNIVYGINIKSNQYEGYFGTKVPECIIVNDLNTLKVFNLNSEKLVKDNIFIAEDSTVNNILLNKDIIENKTLLEIFYTPYSMGGIQASYERVFEIENDNFKEILYIPAFFIDEGVYFCSIINIKFENNYIYLSYYYNAYDNFENIFNKFSKGEISVKYNISLNKIDKCHLEYIQLKDFKELNKSKENKYNLERELSIDQWNKIINSGNINLDESKNGLLF